MPKHATEKRKKTILESAKNMVSVPVQNLIYRVKRTGSKKEGKNPKKGNTIFW